MQLGVREVALPKLGDKQGAADAGELVMRAGMTLCTQGHEQSCAVCKCWPVASLQTCSCHRTLGWLCVWAPASKHQPTNT
jgi:hypothetical protein